jgi:hypothetical protein
MSLIRRVLLTFGAVTLIIFAIGARYYCKGSSRNAIRNARVAGRPPLEEPERRRLDQHRAVFRPFAIAGGYNSKTPFLVDMGLPTGKYRFFVADLEKDTLLLAGLVAHGSGNHTFAVHPRLNPFHATQIVVNLYTKFKLGKPQSIPEEI